MSKPRISIGLPVYNGGEQLRHAIEVLLAQSEPNFELIISDNCSTDEITQKITEEYARQDSRIRLTRQPINLGAQGNFLWLLQQAQGDYFLWAAHDDGWSPNYVETLARCLTESPDAVLATGFTEVVSINETGKVSHSTTLMAPNTDRWKTVDVFSEEFACVWIYGMFRTQWLRDAAPELLRYPFHYGDLIWLFGTVLTEQVVGHRSAVFYYHQLRGKYKDRSYRKKMELWASVAYHVIHLSWTRLPAHERLIGLRKACWLVYRHHVSRGNLIGTSIRIVKLTALWTLFGLEAAVRRVVSLFARSPSRLDQSNLKIDTQDKQQEGRRAA